MSLLLMVHQPEQVPWAGLTSKGAEHHSAQAPTLGGRTSRGPSRPCTRRGRQPCLHPGGPGPAFTPPREVMGHLP